MRELQLQDLNEETWAQMEYLAALHGRTLQEQITAMLEEATRVFTPEDALLVALHWQRKLGDRTFSDSADLIREDREQ